MRAQGEPSVEEILDSIKKVIARDNRVPAGAPRLNLAESHDDDVLDLADSDQYFHEEPAPTGPAADLISEPAISSMRESLAALAMMSQPSSRPQIVRSGETSLEGLVADLLKPALREWLDQNLPAMVERMVAAEIARIVGKKG
ncbi:DUF2497 domain-containing protein [Novosphingobium humi]|uniref:DUF2497 domain-containing protein n=1 Tax=Novosphingobium humi TaxID=2282397 RepID=A0ABY7U015_9SPHN|nr:DUF2497 domain-containing protein [Novosphingobium humi]WCT77394.1 DUF2497 domain-containing protein [Novosphingobium humi]WJS99084.1 DUF2497 domain-containing protein [Novosphingobium humi]